MMSSPPDPTRIPVYNFAVPTEADAVAALQRVWGADRGARLWSDACVAAGVRRGRLNDTDQLSRATSALAAAGGATATVARSIEIRLRTHARLAAKAAATGSGARA
jgi:hypothetical protein